jgi:hypothetical protein
MLCEVRRKPGRTEAEHAGIRTGDAVCASSAFSHRSIVLEMSGRLREDDPEGRSETDILAVGFVSDAAAVMHGDLTTVAEWVRAIEPSTQRELDPALAFKRIMLARSYLTQRQLDAAQQLLDRLLPAALAAGRIGQVLEISLLQTAFGR